MVSRFLAGAAAPRPRAPARLAQRRHARRLRGDALGDAGTAARVSHAGRGRVSAGPQHRPARQGGGLLRGGEDRSPRDRHARAQSVSRRDAGVPRRPWRARCRSASLARCRSTRRTPTPSKADVIRRGAALGVPFELTLSCMNPPVSRQRSHPPSTAASAASAASGTTLSSRPASPIPPSYASTAHLALTFVDSPHGAAYRARVRWAIPAALVLATATLTAQAPPDIDTLLARVGERIADYYKRAQNVVCIEKTTVQPLGHGFSPSGFARITESELRVEPETVDGDGSATTASFVRQLVKVNGRPPREKDKKDRAGCTDPESAVGRAAGVPAARQPRGLHASPPAGSARARTRRADHRVHAPRTPKARAS